MVVATASLELGIDIGHVDVVCHIGSPRNLAVLLQRVGRSGHWLGAIPKGIFYPLTRDDLLQSVAAIRAVRQGELDKLDRRQKNRSMSWRSRWSRRWRAWTRPQQDTSAKHEPAQRTASARKRCGSWSAGVSVPKILRGRISNSFWKCSARAWKPGAAGAAPIIHRDRIHGMLAPRRGARLTAITNGGAIPDTADYDVVEFPSETFVGKVNEDFAIESLAGDIFLLGNRSWRIRRVGSGKVWVDDAEGLPPTHSVLDGRGAGAHAGAVQGGVRFAQGRGGNDCRTAPRRRNG